VETYAVIDFETTGISPDMGARPTEIAAVLVRDGELIGRYQSLMNAGVRVPAEIEALTGISNAMVRGAPSVRQVMHEVAEFVGEHAMVAHNAAFDAKFWDAELARLGKCRPRDFICSMLLARRLVPQAANHKLGTLVRTLGLPATGRYHRALADAEATAYLLLSLKATVRERYPLAHVDHDLLVQMQRVPRSSLNAWMARALADKASVQ